MNENSTKTFKDKVKFFESKSAQNVQTQLNNKSINIQAKNSTKKTEVNLSKFPDNLNDYEIKTKNIIHPIKESKIIELIKNNEQKLDIYHYLNKNIVTSDFNRVIGILFVGQSGAGKSTLINAYTNFLLGVKYDQPCRYKMIIENKEKAQTISQTEEIIIYNLQSPLYPGIIFKLIDTPGIGDTEFENIETKSRIELTSNKKYLEKFENFFNDKLIETELTLVICFVVKALENRITNYQKEIFSNIINLFGKNVGNNLLALFTHADTDEPNAIQVLTRVIDEFKKKNEKNEKWYWCFSSKKYFQLKKGKSFASAYNENIESFISFTKKIINKKSIDISLTKKNLYLNKKLNDLKKLIINEYLFSILNNYKIKEDKDKTDESNKNIEKQVIKEIVKIKIIFDEINKIELQSNDNKSFEKQLIEIFEDNDIFIKNSDKLAPLLKKTIVVLKENEEKLLKEYNINKNDLINMK